MRKQANPFEVKTARLPSGERLPLLRYRATGIPLFQPTVWSLTELRGRNQSSSTIQQALRAVMVLNLVLERLGIDLDARIYQGKLLDLGEVEEVAAQCRLPLKELAFKAAEPALDCPKKVRLEKARMRSSAATAQPMSVHSDTAAIRIRYIRDYLKWRATVRLLKLGPKHELFTGLETTAKTITSTLSERIPPSSGRNSLEQREGISPEALSTLLRVSDPVSPENPWNDDHTRERNALIVKWLLSLGVRRGELLGVRISDINFQTNAVLIARRADNPDDPRKEQPNTKTKARQIPIDEDLAVLTRRYIVGARRAIPGARRHEFLIVATGTGSPLTLGAVNKTFDALRRRCPELPPKLCPHVCRHTWNDGFSDLMEEQGIPEEDEKRMRSQLMGWSQTSDTAAIYTRRHVRNKANKASLELQKKQHTEKPDEK